MALPFEWNPGSDKDQRTGCVDSTNRSVRIEFWNAYDGPLTVAAAPKLAQHESFHNYEPPHWALCC